MEDTIAAISTPVYGSGGISIIRISGDEAIETADRIFKAASGMPLSETKSHTINYGHITDIQTGEIIDEVLVSLMRAPRTFTTKDTVEINCHGGIFVTKKILEEVFKSGARPAEPGEFTKMAFLGGRIDLAEAEAVADIINAKSSLSLKAAQGQLAGRVSGEVKTLRNRILDHIAFAEAAMDDPENIDMDGHREDLSRELEEIKDKISGLLKTFNEGKMIREGINTVILGRTNAGKSSLFNLLAGSESAIVTDIEGTTRDMVRESVLLGDLVLNIADTAGIRKTEDKVEAIGVSKAMDAALDADLILHVIDGTGKLEKEDFEIAKKAPGKNRIVIINKKDLGKGLSIEDISGLYGERSEAVFISSLTGEGLESLESKVKELFSIGSIAVNEEPVIASSRHKALLDAALVSLEKVTDGINAGFGEDLFTIDLMDAYSSLGLIIGEETEDDLADRIFEKFCMGK